MGHRLVLDVPDDVYKSLVKIAEQTGQSQEILAVEWLAAASRYLAHDPLERFIGAFNSSGSDWANNHDLYIGKSLKETMQSVEPKGHSDV
jgi:hypothetical protein